MTMLFDPARHETLATPAWDPQRVRAALAGIVDAAEAAWLPQPGHWPNHPLDLEPGEDPLQPSTTLYFGAAGVMWALRHLHALGATRAPAWLPTPVQARASLLALNRAWLATQGCGAADFGSYLMGELPIEMMASAEPSPEGAAAAERVAALIEGGLAHPARELMWGAPGGLLAAVFMQERRPQEPRWAALYRRVAERLWAELQWSPEQQCHYWSQDLYGRRYSFLDGVHGFVATAHALIRGRHLLPPEQWQDWARVIETTMARSATWDRAAGLANWRNELLARPGAMPQPMLLQFCHGAPGFVICLAGLPGPALDGLLQAAGELVWAAGPLAKGANLCHGTAGNGYAFLKLYERSGEARWLERARAFAMHAIAQAEAERRRHGQHRFSLWTGDLGLACFLWDCLRGRAAFPTLDLFWPEA